MKSYKSHKVVEAAQILGAVHDGAGGAILTLQGDGTEVRERVDHKWLQKNGGLAVLMGGYFVRYPDGYTSWSPAAAFEEGYTALDGRQDYVVSGENADGSLQVKPLPMPHIYDVTKDEFRAITQDDVDLWQGMVSAYGRMRQATREFWDATEQERLKVKGAPPARPLSEAPEADNTVDAMAMLSGLQKVDFGAVSGAIAPPASAEDDWADRELRMQALSIAAAHGTTDHLSVVYRAQAYYSFMRGDAPAGLDAVNGQLA